jgi:hypothetical protein
MAFKTGPLLSPKHFREIFLPKMKIIADTIKIPWVFHSDGDLNLVLEDLLTLGMNAINPFEPPIMGHCCNQKEIWAQDLFMGQHRSGLYPNTGHTRRGR